MGHLKDEILSSPTSLSSQTYKSNGLITRRIPLLTSHQIQSPSRTQTDDEVLPAADGTKIDAQTQLLAATTYMCAPSAPTQATSQVAVTPQGRSDRVDLTLQWEHRPRFVRDYVWPDDDSCLVTMALTSLMAPPLPEPPKNEFVDIEK